MKKGLKFKEFREGVDDPGGKGEEDGAPDGVHDDGAPGPFFDSGHSSEFIDSVDSKAEKGGFPDWFLSLNNKIVNTENKDNIGKSSS